jgi:hypothetical protein
MLLIDYCNAMLHVYTKTVFKTEITPMSALTWLARTTRQDT